MAVKIKISTGETIMNLPTAINFFLNYTFNDYYIIYFGVRKQQIIIKIDDHQDTLIVDKIVGLINNNEGTWASWEKADYFFNGNDMTPESQIETMTLCVGAARGKNNFSREIVILQPFDHMMIHTDNIAVAGKDQTSNVSKHPLASQFIGFLADVDPSEMFKM